MPVHETNLVRKIEKKKLTSPAHPPLAEVGRGKSATKTPPMQPAGRVLLSWR